MCDGVLLLPLIFVEGAMPQTLRARCKVLELKKKVVVGSTRDRQARCPP
jgi:predicted membrane GTPase involved in stress response